MLGGLTGATRGSEGARPRATTRGRASRGSSPRARRRRRSRRRSRTDAVAMVAGDSTSRAARCPVAEARAEITRGVGRGRVGPRRGSTKVEGRTCADPPLFRMRGKVARPRAKVRQARAGGYAPRGGDDLGERCVSPRAARLWSRVRPRLLTVMSDRPLCPSSRAKSQRPVVAAGAHLAARRRRSRPRAMSLSKAERAFVRDGIEQNVRVDGRARDDYRSRRSSWAWCLRRAGARAFALVRRT